MKSIIQLIERILPKSFRPLFYKGVFLLPPKLFIGDCCRILGRPQVYLTRNSKILIGRNVLLNSIPKGYHAAMVSPVTMTADREGAIIEVGDGSRLHGCFIHSWDRITIGKGCLVASGVQIMDANGHISGLENATLRSTEQDSPEPITIGDYCWLGINSIILKGVKLGEGCIVSANSVVTRGTYPPYSLLSGVPAKIVKTIQ